MGIGFFSDCLCWSLPQKKSFLTQYGINVSDAVISNVDYEELVDKLLTDKIRMIAAFSELNSKVIEISS